MITTTQTGTDNSALLHAFNNEGFYLARSLFGREETRSLREHCMSLYETAPAVAVDSGYGGTEKKKTSQTKETARNSDFNRIIHPHRFDETSKQYLLDERVLNLLRLFLGEEPVAAQTMVFYKSPGSKGMHLHQDNLYLDVKPGNCIAAWVALEKCDPENGCLRVVPDTHDMPLACAKDQDEKFVDWKHRTTEAVDVEMEPGDVLFFGGNLLHGSHQNDSKDRWRVSFVSHYVPESCKHVSEFYAPLINTKGEIVERDFSKTGGPCGGV